MACICDRDTCVPELTRWTLSAGDRVPLCLVLALRANFAIDAVIRRLEQTGVAVLAGEL